MKSGSSTLAYAKLSTRRRQCGWSLFWESGLHHRQAFAGSRSVLRPFQLDGTFFLTLPTPPCLLRLPPTFSTFRPAPRQGYPIGTPIPLIVVSGFLHYALLSNSPYPSRRSEVSLWGRHLTHRGSNNENGSDMVAEGE